MKKLIRLSEAPLQQCVTVARIIRRDSRMIRICDMGITEGSEITPVFRSPFGDPTAYAVKHTLIALRESDSRNIWVRCEDEL